MRRQIVFVIAGLTVLISFSGCVIDQRLTLAKDYTKAKQWDAAVENITEILSDPGATPMTKKSAGKVFAEAGPPFYQEHEEQAKLAKDAENWDVANYHSDIIQRTAEVVAGAAPEVKVKAPDMEAFDAEVNPEAAALHYEQGLRLQQKAQSKADFKEAAKEFRRAFEYVANYEDARQRYESCKEQGKMLVLLLPFRDGPGEGAGLGQVFPNALQATCAQNPQLSEFLNLELPEQFRIKAAAAGGATLTANSDIGSLAQAARGLGYDAIITGQFTNVYTSYPPESQTSIRRERTVTKYVKKADGTSYSYEKAVAATVYYYERTASADVAATFQILDVDGGAILKSGDYSGRQVEAFQWARFSGDEDALTSADSKLCKLPEGRPKSPEANIAIALQQVLENFANEIGVFFNK